MCLIKLQHKFEEWWSLNVTCEGLAKNINFPSIISKDIFYLQAVGNSRAQVILQRSNVNIATNISTKIASTDTWRIYTDHLKHGNVSSVRRFLKIMIHWKIIKAEFVKWRQNKLFIIYKYVYTNCIIWGLKMLKSWKASMHAMLVANHKT